MISISGVRGIVGETLTPDVVTRFSAAFGTFCKGEKVVVGRDARASGSMLKDCVTAGLRSAGCDVIDSGTVTTPTIQYLVKERNAQGGVAITASHNPIEWNAMKFIHKTGIFLDQEQARKLIGIYEKNNIKYVPWHKIGKNYGESEGARKHAEHVLKSIDTDSITASQPTVAIDCCNSSSSEILQILLDRIGCTTIAVNCERDGTFHRGPEPTPENLEALSRVVRENDADVGFATDPDGDRLSIIDEKGNPAGEEYSLTLATQLVLQERQGPVVTNVATTKAVEDVASSHGCEFARAPVGEVNVVKKMMELGAVIGGEGNGGVINPSIQYARDAPAGMSLVLQGMCDFEGPISQLLSTLPEYHMIKEKIQFDPTNWEMLLNGLREHFRGQDIDLTDGIRVTRKDSSIYVRKSGTEPLVRVICEAKDEMEASRLTDQTTQLVNDILEGGTSNGR